MGLNLSLQALIMPDGSEFEGTRQALQNSVAQYLAIVGEENFTGINYGPTTPDPINRDRPWFKTDNAFQPIGWFVWNGTIWAPIPLFPQSGTFATAPMGLALGQLYYATDINVMCQWNGASWVTQDGMSGEIRFIRGTSVSAVLTKYPGWFQVTDMEGYVPGVASDGSASGFDNNAPESNGGERTHTQTVDEMPSHSHSYATAPSRTGVAGANPLWANDSTGATGATGGGTAMSWMQPTWFLITIQKT